MTGNRRGQMSLMLIVLIAVGLIGLAMVMNWNRIVQGKTQTQVAATSAAATMASLIGSYGENTIQTQLGGSVQKCGWTGVLSLIIIIIIIVVMYFCPQCGAALSETFGPTVMGAIAVAGAFAVASLVIQVAIIQPAITRMWNKMQQNITTPEDRYLETGVQTAMQLAISDSVQMPDVIDYNTNGRLNIPWDPALRGTDTVSRLTYHYTSRLQNIVQPDLTAIEAFLKALSEMHADMGMDGGDFCSTNQTYSNPACQFVDGKDPADQPALAANCGFDGANRRYPFSYDSLFCSGTLSSSTLIGVLGVDDSWDDLRKTGAAGTDQTLAGTSFRAQDSYGLLFPFLWNLLDANTVLAAAQTAYPGSTVMDTATLSSMVAQAAPASCPGTDGNGIWRPGNDSFCNERPLNDGPHNGPCPKFSPSCQDPDNDGGDCSCDASPDPSLWHDDKIDEALQKLRSIQATVTGLITDKTVGAAILNAQAAEWTEQINGAFEEMVAIRGDLKDWRDKIDGWLSGTYSAGFCTGTLPQVVDCLNRQVTVSKPLFQACQANCTACNTSTLPAGMVTVPAKSSGVACSAAVTSALAANIALSDLAGAPATGRGAQLNNARTRAQTLLTNLDAAIRLSFYYTLDAAGEVQSCASPTATLNDCPYDPATNSFNCSDPVPGSPDCYDRLALLHDLFDAIEVQEQGAEPVTGPYLIYGWEGAAAKGKDRGYRHVVKIEMALPKRCRWWTAERGTDSKSCGTNKFPWVKTSKRGCCKRCYSITDTDGCVKARVTRFDEDRSQGLVRFAGGQPLWQFWNRQTVYDGVPAPGGLETCFNHDRLYLTPGGPWFDVPDSFMINRDLDYEKYGLECQAAVESALRQGYFSEVCAKYYLDGSVYRIKFIPCRSNKTCGEL